MRVFKFGGASVKDANAITNVVDIVQSFVDSRQPIIMIVSAIGKTTNKLELIAKACVEKNSDIKLNLAELINEHIEISKGLGFSEDTKLCSDIYSIEKTISEFITQNESENYNFIYDQLVSKGEILSTTILFHYIASRSINTQFLNARNLIKTDSNYTDANILWPETELAIKNELKSTQADVIITQGFIGASPEMFYTTLGREGSDYTAAILAKCTGTDELTIWKDVDGVYTADPKKFPDATIIPQVSYKEAIEMTFYGAQIIHPKTIKPIQNSNCILKVKSFLNKDAKGTEIGNFENVTYKPVIVHKANQVVYTFSVRDFSFINESNIGKIISVFGKYSLRINMMQNTAIEFAVVTDEKLGKNELIISELENDFEIKTYNQLELLTIRHFNEELRLKYTADKQVFLAQQNENTIQYLMR